MGEIAMLAEAEWAVLASVSENALGGRFVELHEFSEQAGIRRDPEPFEHTRAVRSVAHRTAKNQPFALKLDLRRNQPRRRG